MKHWLIILTLAMGIPFYGSSQSFMNRVRDKVKKCVSVLKHEGCDKSLDEVESEFGKTGELNSPNYNFILSARI
jgi:hypothetical protein